ncbi:MAG: hypothetical protein PUE71_10060, partial [Clostridia bacterium]|nr:hypothetical protein [Clostridia bacterium]
PELVSLLQYMKNTRLDNPAIIVQDERIVKLDKVVEEVKQSEEWEAVKMNILDIGIKKGQLNLLYTLVNSGKLTIEEAAESIDVTVDELKKEFSTLAESQI